MHRQTRLYLVVPLGVDHSLLGPRPGAYSHSEVKPLAHSGLGRSLGARILLGVHCCQLMMEVVL